MQYFFQVGTGIQNQRFIAWVAQLQDRARRNQNIGGHGPVIGADRIDLRVAIQSLRV
jgi:hypothetical protein